MSWSHNDTPTTILVIDPDLGFILALSRALLAAGYQVIPASTMEEAATLTSELGLGIDAVVAEAGALASGGSDPMGGLGRWAARSAMIVATSTPEALAGQLPVWPAAVLRKPQADEPDLTDEWLRIIRQVLALSR